MSVSVPASFLRCVIGDQHGMLLGIACDQDLRFEIPLHGMRWRLLEKLDTSVDASGLELFGCCVGDSRAHSSTFAVAPTPPPASKAHHHSLHYPPTEQTGTMVKLLRSLFTTSVLLLATSASLSSAGLGGTTTGAGGATGVTTGVTTGATTGAGIAGVAGVATGTTTAAAGAAAGASAGTSATKDSGRPFKGTPPLVIKGYRFFDSSTGGYFGIRGVNYYPRPNTGALDANNLDLFTDKFARLRGRDFPQFVALGANAIRLYAVDPDVDHTPFMCELQAEGIYVVVDLGSSCKGCEITPDPAPACYPASYKTRGEAIIKQFAKFDNVVGFSGGNEVNHRSAGKGLNANAPCQKMFVRDMRNYIASCKSSMGMRQIPVGLVTADSDRDLNALYYNCESSDLGDERAEWYGINTYIQCDDIADPKMATGFNMLRDSFKGCKYSIPVILTEFGCTTDRFPTVKEYKGQRTFHDTQWMNSADYSEYFAGGFAFEYSTENANSKSTSVYPFTEFGPQNYGLGYLKPVDCDDVTKPCSFQQMPNFQSLATAYKATDTSAEPTLDKFKPAADRMAPSKCPADYLPIGGLTWEGGLKPTSECPLSTEAKFQCPKSDRYSLLKGTSNGAGGNSSTNSTKTKRNSTKDSSGGSDNGEKKTPKPTPLPITKTPSSRSGNGRDNLESAESSSGSLMQESNTNDTSIVSSTKTSRASSLVSSGVVTAAIAVALALLQL